jgi:hypothetical protein
MTISDDRRRPSLFIAVLALLPIGLCMWALIAVLLFATIWKH